MNRRRFLASAVVTSLALAARSTASGSAKKLKVGIIGHTGRGNYGHGLDMMWLRLPETEIVAVADPDPAGLAAAKERLKVGQGFLDYRELLSSARPEIVAICPRHIDQHRDMVLAAVAAGVRGIYMEKPFCRTPAEADEIVAACEAAQVRIAVAHRNRWHPAVPTAQRLIEEGRIGRVLEIRARGKEDRRGGGLDLWVLGSHLLNMAVVFGGEPRFCTATVLNEGRLVGREDVFDGAEGIGPLAGDEIHARFDLEKGFPLYFDSIKDAGVAAAGFGFSIVGSEGVIDFRADEEPAFHIVQGSTSPLVRRELAWLPVTSGGIGVPEPIADVNGLVMNHILPARDLLASIAEGREPLCSARDGALTVEMICSVFDSHRQGGGRVELPLSARGNPLLWL